MSRAVVFGCSGARLTSREAALFRDADPWGFILFGRNIETPDQVRQLTGSLRDCVGWHAPVLIDQEGGRVERLTAPHWRSWLNALEQMALNPSLRAIRLRYQIIASELLDVGIDVNCAPVLDIARAQTHDVIKERCFGFDPETVAMAGRECARGLLDMGVLPVIKHMPGHGLAKVDSHKDVPHVALDRAILARTDFVPFKALNDLPIGMSAHVVYQEIDDDPGTLSPKVNRVIRDEIGFDGLLLTDDISMGALDGSHASRATRALDAGCDIILHCSGDMGEMLELSGVIPNLDGKAAFRANTAINSRQPQDIVDIEGAIAEYGDLIKTDS